MPNILQILPELESGGVERGTLEIAEYLVKKNYKSFVVSSGGKLEKPLTEAGSTHIYLDTYSKNPLEIIANIFRLEKIIKEYKIDLVHARSRGPAWSAYFAAKMTNTPFLTTFHGVYSGTSYFKKLYNSVMLRGKKIITVSDFITNHISKNYGPEYADKITRIHRGVDLEEFNDKQIDAARVKYYRKNYNIPADKKIILFPGRITAWKGHEFFIEALSKINYADYFVVIVGADPVPNNCTVKLKEKITELGLENKVTIQPAIRDLVNLYALADLVISASLRPEAFGRTIVEAGALGKIVIATKHGGACETILNGDTGFLVEPHDIEDFATNLERALTLPKTQQTKLEKNAKQRIVKEFSIGKMQEKTFKLYNEILNIK